jgi:hypothetical protein
MPNILENKMMRNCFVPIKNPTRQICIKEKIEDKIKIEKYDVSIFRSSSE